MNSIQHIFEVKCRQQHGCNSRGGYSSFDHTSKYHIMQPGEKHRVGKCYTDAVAPRQPNGKWHLSTIIAFPGDDCQTPVSSCMRVVRLSTGEPNSERWWCQDAQPGEFCRSLVHIEKRLSLAFETILATCTFYDRVKTITALVGRSLLDWRGSSTDELYSSPDTTVGTPPAFGNAIRVYT